MLLTGYGTTENAGGLTGVEPMEDQPDCVGHLIPGVQIKIISDDGHKCGVNEEGEIYSKTPVRSMGYFRDAEANQMAFDADGYFRTGDIGYFDEEARLHLSGRKKEMFKVRNFAIWPSELDNVIQKHPGVRYASVVNVFDEDLTTDLAAAVVVKNNQLNVTEDDIYALIAGSIEISFYFFVEF